MNQNVVEFYNNKNKLIYDAFNVDSELMKEIKNAYFINIRNVHLKLKNKRNKEFIFYNTEYFFPAYISNKNYGDKDFSIDLNGSFWKSNKPKYIITFGVIPHDQK